MSNRSLGRSILPKQSSSSSWPCLQTRVTDRDLARDNVHSRNSLPILRCMLVAVPSPANARALRVQSPNDAFVSPLNPPASHYVAYRKSHEDRTRHKVYSRSPASRHTYLRLLVSSLVASLHWPIAPASLLCYRAVLEEGAPTTVRVNRSILLSSQAWLDNRDWFIARSLEPWGCKRFVTAIMKPL